MKQLIRKIQSIITTKTLAYVAASSLLISCINAQQTIVDQVDLSFDNITTVEVEGSFCQVNINAIEGHMVSFKGVIKASKAYDDLKIKYTEDNHVLKIWLEKPNMNWGNIDGKLELSLPIATNIMVDNSSGSVQLDGIQGGTVDLNASSGSISAKNIISSVNIKTSSGSQKIENIKGDIKSSASSGSINITEVKGSLSAQCSSGGIQMNNIQGDVNAKTTSGSIRGNDIIGNVNGNSSSGSIKISTVTGSLNLVSSSGSQSGNQIKLTGNSSFSASSGIVHMELINDAEELSFNLNASSGSISAKGIKGHDSLTISKGFIVVTGNTSSGSQSYQ